MAKTEEELGADLAKVALEVARLLKPLFRDAEYQPLFTLLVSHPKDGAMRDDDVRIFRLGNCPAEIQDHMMIKVMLSGSEKVGGSMGIKEDADGNVVQITDPEEMEQLVGDVASEQQRKRDECPCPNCVRRRELERKASGGLN